jgi:hypothetical protein
MAPGLCAHVAPWAPARSPHQHATQPVDGSVPTWGCHNKGTQLHTCCGIAEAHLGALGALMAAAAGGAPADLWWGLRCPAVGGGRCGTFPIGQCGTNRTMQSVACRLLLLRHPGDAGMEAGTAGMQAPLTCPVGSPLI